MIDGEKENIIELLAANDVESRKLLNEEIYDFGVYIRSLQLFIQLT
jgi:hypothetical protein